MSTVVKPTEGSDQTAVHSFHVEVPDAELTDLRRRIRVPGEIYQAPRSWTEQAYPKLIHHNKVAKGGHYAPWEQPKMFSEEVRAGLRSLRA